MEMLILIVGLGFFFGVTFVGTWLLRGNGLSELWPGSRPAGPPPRDDRSSGIPSESIVRNRPGLATPQPDTGR